MIKPGDKLKISGDLVKVLHEIGIEPSSAKTINRFAGTLGHKAASVWTDDTGQRWVTVDLCCEIPEQCCQVIS